MISRFLIRLGLIWLVFLCLGLTLASTNQPSVAETLDDPITATLNDVPHIQQLPGFGGEACTAMALQRLGHKHDQLDIFNLTDLHPEVGRGCSTHDLARLLPT